VKSAVTVRIRDGKLSTVDGPFAETKEQLGGFIAIEAKDIDEAVAVAAKSPSPNSAAWRCAPCATPATTAETGPPIGDRRNAAGD
jgi:hypothetical protein